MEQDEKAIRELVATWMKASKARDVETVLGLMTEDVVFMVPGREPFGKKAFEEQSRGAKGAEVEGKAEIVEIQVLGEWAWLRNKLRVEIRPAGGAGGEKMVLAGYTLTILRKEAGKWALARDANLLMPEKRG